MKAKIMYVLIICSATCTAIWMLEQSWGMPISLMMKMFVLFLGLLFGYQAIPAVLRCINLVAIMMKPEAEKSINNSKSF